MHLLIVNSMYSSIARTLYINIKCLTFILHLQSIILIATETMEMYNNVYRYLYIFICTPIF